jgi:thiamine biosynthesis lipoprotein
MRIFSAFIIMLALVACDEAQTQKTLTTISGPTMGTTFNVKVVDLPKDVPAQKLKDGILQVLEDVNDKMSLWVKGSEIIRFNQSTSTDWQDVSEDFYKVTEKAFEISDMTEGRFDVTLEPLIKLWGFSTKRAPANLPSDADIKEALDQVGYKKIELDAAALRMKKQHAAMSVNLSAIAKGFGIDQVSQFLENKGIENYMVEIGGDLRVKGSNAKEQPWRIAIEKPEAGSRSVQKIIALQGVGMATSGDYRNFYEKDAQRYTHIIDPVKGRPVLHKLASVTVLSETAMEADGLATALLVMGPDEGMKIAEENAIAAFFLVRDKDGFVEKRSTRFKTYEDVTK